MLPDGTDPASALPRPRPSLTSRITSGALLLQAALLVFAAISAVYRRSRIDVALRDAAARSGLPADDVSLKASHFHLEVRAELSYTLFFAPLLIGVAIWLWRGHQQENAQFFAGGISALSVLCCCGAGGSLWMADEPAALDHELPTAFGDAYPAWAEIGQLGLMASMIFPLVVALLIVADRANAKGS